MARPGEPDDDELVSEFTKRTGMSPRRCYWLVLLSLTLRLVGESWVAVVSLEYTRYYVVNDLSLINVLQTATGSPIAAVQAFVFPMWGVVADRVSRKKLLVAASMAACASAWLTTLVPCVEVYIIVRLLALVRDISSPIRDAVLRDLFSERDWERSNGGITGIKARMGIVSALALGVSGVAAMAAMKLGDAGLGLQNEYTVRQIECYGQRHCVPRGQFSWEGGWHIDGCLRLLMVGGTLVLTLDALVVTFLLPETIRPEHQTETSVCSFIRSNWREHLRPWNNLRALATPQLRMLMVIRVILFVAASGLESMFLVFYRRFQPDTFLLYVLAACGGMAGLLAAFAVPRLVDRWGDLRGIWIPGNVLSLLHGLLIALVPGSMLYVMCVLSPLIVGPATTFQAVAPELLAKLVAPDVQGTYQTGKSFLYFSSRAIFMWGWTGLTICSEAYPYPFDALPLFVAAALCSVALWLTVWSLRDDPREAIRRGDALEAFWASPYAKGRWYRQHTVGSGSGVPEGAGEALPARSGSAGGAGTDGAATAAAPSPSGGSSPGQSAFGGDGPTPAGGSPAVTPDGAHVQSV